MQSVLERKIFQLFNLSLLGLMFWGLCSAKKLKELSLKSNEYQVLDGDTLLIKNGQKVRFIFIDALELDQDIWIKNKKIYQRLHFGKWSHQQLVKKLKNQNLTLKIYGKGHYGRLLAEVFITNTKENINQWMIKNGLALVFSVGYPKPPSHYYLNQNRAIQAQKNLWSAHHFQRPKHHRKHKK